MMPWFAFLLLIAGAVGALLWPLIPTPEGNRRLRLIAIAVIVMIVPAGTMLVYYYLGTPQ